MLDHGLSVGPLKLNLADINWPDSVQDKLDVLNDALLGLFVLYALAMGFSGLAMFTNAAAFLLPGRPPVVLANLVLGALGGLSCLIGSIVVSVAGSKGVREINDKGARIGLSAERGIKFYILTWISTGFMLGVAVFWVSFIIIDLLTPYALWHEIVKERNLPVAILAAVSGRAESAFAAAKDGREVSISSSDTISPMQP